MKAKDTLLFNNIITQNPMLAKKAWFWHVVLHFITILSSAPGMEINSK